MQVSFTVWGKWPRGIFSPLNVVSCLIMTGGIFESFYAEFALTPCDASSQEVLRSRVFFRKFRLGRIVFLLHLNENLPEMCKSWNILFIFIAHFIPHFPHNVVPKAFRIFQPLQSLANGWHSLDWYLLILHVVSPKTSHQRSLLLWPHLDRPWPQFKNDSKGTVKVWCATSC